MSHLTHWTKRLLLTSLENSKAMRRPLRSTLILNARMSSLPSIKNAKAQSFLGLRVNIRRTMFLSYLYASHALMVKIMVVGLLKNYLATYAHLRHYHKLLLRAQPQLQKFSSWLILTVQHGCEQSLKLKIQQSSRVIVMTYLYCRWINSTISVWLTKLWAVLRNVFPNNSCFSHLFSVMVSG